MSNSNYSKRICHGRTIASQTLRPPHRPLQDKDEQTPQHAHNGVGDNKQQQQEKQLFLDREQTNNGSTLRRLFVLLSGTTTTTSDNNNDNNNNNDDKIAGKNTEQGDDRMNSFFWGEKTFFISSSFS